MQARRRLGKIGLLKLRRCTSTVLAFLNDAWMLPLALMMPHQDAFFVTRTMPLSLLAAEYSRSLGLIVSSELETGLLLQLCASGQVRAMSGQLQLCNL